VTTVLDRPKTQPEINKFRRESLIRATLQVVAEKGIQSATIADICTAAGVSRGLANHYFDSKDQLLECAFRAMFKELDIVSAEAEAAEDRATRKLLAITYATFSNDFFNPTARAANLSFWSASLASVPLSAINREVYSGYHQHLQSLFADAAREHGVTLDARHAAISLIGMIDGLWLGLALRNGQFTPDLAYRMCREHIKAQLKLSEDDPILAQPLDIEKRTSLSD
jgi:AcrR family transcriptional regulator